MVIPFISMFKTTFLAYFSNSIKVVNFDGNKIIWLKSVSVVNIIIKNLLKAKNIQKWLRTKN